MQKIDKLFISLLREVSIPGKSKQIVNKKVDSKSQDLLSTFKIFQQMVYQYSFMASLRLNQDTQHLLF